MKHISSKLIHERFFNARDIWDAMGKVVRRDYESRIKTDRRQLYLKHFSGLTLNEQGQVVNLFLEDNILD